jgi:hypothetical protein
VQLRTEEGQPGDLMQVAKQLFDIGTLFEAARNFAEVAATYDAVRRLESEYRGNKHSREACLRDTIQACVAVTASRQRELAAYPE